MVNLGFLYYWGKGIKKDRVKAAELNQKAANMGNKIAQYNLGRAYESGNGIPEDKKKLFTGISKLQKMEIRWLWNVFITDIILNA